MSFSDVEKYALQNKEEVISLLCEYVSTDTILFWNTDEKLDILQQQKWQPIIDFANREIGLNLQKTYNLFPQNANHQNLKKYIRTLYLNELTALYAASSELKSVLLAIAFIKGKISAEEAFQRAFLEEFYQNKQWGTDKEAEEKRQQIKQRMVAIEGYLQKNG